MIKNARKIVIAAASVAVITLSACFSLAAEGGAGSTVFQSIVDLGSGLKYTNTISQNSSYGREESYMLESMPGENIRPIVLACDTIYGALNIDKVMNYAAGLGYKVAGAVNSDFFIMSSGVPLGIAVEDGVYKSSPQGYSSVCFDSEGNASILENTNVKMLLTNNGGAPLQQPEPQQPATELSDNGQATDDENTAESGNAADSSQTSDSDAEGSGDVKQPVSNAGKKVSVTILNKLRNQYGGLFLLDEHFSTVSTRTSDPGWMVRFKVLSGKLTVNGQVELEVVEKLETSKAQKIGAGYMILTADDRAGLHYVYDMFAVGDKVTLTTSCTDEALKNCSWATGAGDVLIKDGKITDSSKWDSAISYKNPRSALGIKADGTVIYYTVDGRKSEHSNGLTLSQLAAELLALGCVDAVNFDGGGSTAMAVKLPGDSSAEVQNIPSDGALRKCSTYVLLTAGADSAQQPVKIHLADDDMVVLKGSSASLSYKATDGNLNQTALPADIQTVVSQGSGTVNGNIYTAGNTAGMETLSFTSADGTEGTGTVYVTDKVSSVKVKSGGSSVSTLNVERNQQIQLSVSAEYYGKDVKFNASDVIYYMPPEMGTVDKNGLVTISDRPVDKSWVSATLGGVTSYVVIQYEGVFSDITGHWAKDYITDLYDKGITTGSGNGKFMPDTSIKRGDFILMLYRTAGNPDSDAESGFEDVKNTDYYASAVSWAKNSGIAKGDGVRFNPQANMTREEAFTFIYRYLSTSGEGMDEADITEINQFSDAESISDFAKIPAASLVKAGIINGSDGKITPQGLLTRAEMAKILSCALAA